MSGFEEEVPERERQRTPQRGSSITELSLAKLQTRLQAQRGSLKLNLADSFIGDEGCDLVARYLRDNPGTQVLELRGNNITAEGVVRLEAAFQSGCAVKRLSLEWNAIGNGTAAVYDLLVGNTSVTSLDLRNNRIGPEGANPLARLLQDNKSITAVDLRWNDLGAEGSRCLLQTLQATSPQVLTSLELSGNKVPDETLQQLESLLQGRSDERVRPREVPETMISARLVSREKQYSEELQTKYETNLYSQSRLEAKNADLEQLLDQERKRTRDLQSDLLRELEAEKSLRAQAEEALQSHREVVVQRAAEDDRNLQDLDLKLSSIVNEKGALAAELKKLQEQYEKLAFGSQERTKTLEERIEQQQRLFGQLEGEGAKAYEQMRLEQQQTLREAAQEAEERTQAAEARHLTLATAKEGAEAEAKKLRTALAQTQAGDLQELRDLEYRLQEENERRFAANMSLLEDRAKQMEDSRAELTRTNQDLQRDLIRGEKYRLEQLLAIEAERNSLLDERAQLTSTLQQLQSTSDSLKNQVYSLHSSLQSTSASLTSLRSKLTQRQDSSQGQLEDLSKEQSRERGQFETVRKGLGERIARMQGLVAVREAERDRMRDEYTRLHESLRVAVSRTVSDTIRVHMRRLEAETAS